jgi:hypothetical protein
MKDIASISDIKNFIVDVSEEITDKNILNFAHTTLDINNIEYSSSDIIYCRFLKYSKQYQFFVFDDSFKYMMIELINVSDNKKGFNLYISKSFFVIYENNKLYAYQTINQEYSKDELFTFVSKKFNIIITDVQEFVDIELKNIKDEIDIKEVVSTFSNINKKSDKSFLLYIMYLLLCIGITLTYDNYKNKLLDNKKTNLIMNTKKEYLKISKMLKFKPFNIKYKELITTTKKFNLKIISFKYNIESINIKVSAKKKNSIYLFLNNYQKILLGNSIIKLDSKNIFMSTINVKVN